MTGHRDPRLAHALGVIEAAAPTNEVAAFLDLDAIVAPLDAGDPAAGAPLGDWAGKPADELIEDRAARFRRGGASGLSYEAWDLVKTHQQRGHTVVLVASATRDRVMPVAGELDIEHLICNDAEVTEGRLTGRMTSPVMSVAGKRDAIEGFAAAHGIDLQASFAYVARREDAGVLEAVGHAVALNPDPRLRELATGRGWTTIATFDRVAGALGVARTVGGYAAFLASTGVGIAVGLRARRRRAGVDAMTRTFSRLGPPLAGIRIQVQGEQHARAHRPAVFIINHQSSLVDLIVSFHLLREGFTVVAKREVRDIPVIGQATWLADWAYVDRVGDKTQARAAIQGAVDKLEQGVSVILAPEGTRSVGPRPGPFKKGAFFMARAAGVPVVPIVMRNSGELMWRNGKALKGGTVDVIVLPPISCDWSDDEFTARVAEVRQAFVDTLERWPANSKETA